MKKLLPLSIITSIWVFFFPALALAAVPTHTPAPVPHVFCDAGNNPTSGVMTALGCIQASSPKALAAALAGWGLSIGGGIFLLMLIYSGFTLVTASGDPKKVAAGREMLVSAITGIVLILITVVLLNFVGVNLLHLPGFERNSSI
jgi:hypothetical protein